MRKFSFHRILRNDRLMIGLSVLLAILLWYMVISGPANVTTRTITCTLNTSNVQNGSLQVIETAPISVEVRVQGVWSYVNSLTADDLRVQLSTADIQSAGQCRIHVLASYNSQKTDYEVVSVSPATVTLFCDEWVSGKLYTLSQGGVTAEAPAVTAEGDYRDIGSVAIDPAALPGGVIAVQGPMTTINRIERFVARVAEQADISSRQVYDAQVLALDSSGKQVPLEYCTLMRYEEDPAVNPNTSFMEFSGSTLPVAVTVKERREITFEYTVKNAPAGLDPASLIRVEPASITIEGDQELLDQYAEEIARLTEIDFDHLTTAEKARSVPVTLPEGLIVVGSGASQMNVAVNFDWSDYATRTLEWHIGTGLSDTPIQFLNVPGNKEIRMLTNTLNVTVCGSKAAVTALTAADLTATVDMSNSSLGTYGVRPRVEREGVWVYYEGVGYTVYLSITDANP